jgi:hypothetical protein
MKKKKTPAPPKTRTVIVDGIAVDVGGNLTDEEVTAMVRKSLEGEPDIPDDDDDEDDEDDEDEFPDDEEEPAKPKPKPKGKGAA